MAFNFKNTIVDFTGLPVVSGLMSRLMPGLRVLAFHGVPSQETFEKTLLYLKSHFRIISADECIARQEPKSDRAVLITFDDGAVSTIQNAMPALKKHGVSALLFVCPGLITGSRTFWWQVAEAARSQGIVKDVVPGLSENSNIVAYLKTIPDGQRRNLVERFEKRLSSFHKHVADLDMIKQWREAGLDIGNHTWDHPCLDQCSPAEQRLQIEKAHDWLTEFLGKAPNVFAYPNGDWTEESETALHNLGYQRAFLFDHKLARHTSNVLRTSRLRIDADAPLTRVRSIVSGAHSFLFHKASKPGTKRPALV